VGDAHRWVDTNDIYAVGFDQLIPGNGGPNRQSLETLVGRAITPFKIDAFNAGDYAAACKTAGGENLSRVLYRTIRRRRARSFGSSNSTSS